MGPVPSKAGIIDTSQESGKMSCLECPKAKLIPYFTYLGFSLCREKNLRLPFAFGKGSSLAGLGLITNCSTRSVISPKAFAAGESGSAVTKGFPRSQF